MNRSTWAVLAAAASFVACTAAPAAAAGPTGCPLPGFGPGAQYAPHIDPASFSPDVTNPWFPLVPGRTMVYSGTKDGKKALDLFVVTPRTQLVDGVTTRVVEDRLYLNGTLAERTTDYYAQDRCGNVWYFGEDTAVLGPDGKVKDTQGSFRAGVSGAQPGVYLQGSPEVGRRFRQEWLAGQAEDQYAAQALHARVQVPYGAFTDALRTTEQTALEPGVLDEKHYARGIGEVSEVSLRGPQEALRLVEVIH